MGMSQSQAGCAQKGNGDKDEGHFVLHDVTSPTAMWNLIVNGNETLFGPWDMYLRHRSTVLMNTINIFHHNLLVVHHVSLS